MKIKEVCKRTGLTERTVRFYVEESLINPQMSLVNGREYRDYSEQDIAELMIIADLRKLFFTIDEIKEMKESPTAIADVVAAYKLKLKTDVSAKASIMKILDEVDLSSFHDVKSLAIRLSSVSASLPLPERDITPNFGKFDPESMEEKEQQYQQFLMRQKRQFTKGKVIVFTIATINIISSVISAFTDFNFIALVLNIIVTLALFFGVTWVRYLYVFLTLSSVLLTLLLISENAETLSLSTGLLLILVIQLIYMVVSSVLLIKSEAVREFLYAQKNG